MKAEQQNSTALSTSRRQLVFAALGASVVTGCMGSFGLSRSVYEWNSKLGQKMLNGVVFMVLLFTTIYPTLMLIDLFLLNTIEFWLDKKLIKVSSKPNADGVYVASTRTSNGLIRHQVMQDGQVEHVVHTCLTAKGTVVLLDENEKSLAVAGPHEGGAISLDQSGNVVGRLSADEFQALRLDIEAGIAVQQLPLAMNKLVGAHPSGSIFAASNVPFLRAL